MKTVLIVTPFFAPQNHSAVYRAYKLAKYLPQFGWKPIVLTVDRQYEFNEDPSMLTALPPEVEIVPVRYVEPTLRGLRMALGGQDRTFRALRDRGEIRKSADALVSPTRPGLSRRMYHKLLAEYLHVPDSYWTWANQAIHAGTELLKTRSVDLVFTTAAPHSSFTVGLELQKAGIPWVADFRDPLGYVGKQVASTGARAVARQQQIVRETLQRADAVTVTTRSYSSIFFDTFGPGGSNPIFIPTGVDFAAMPTAEMANVPPYPYLIFAGEWLPEYTSEFIDAFARALQNPAVRQTGVKLLVVGTLELNKKRLFPLLHAAGIPEAVEFREQAPQGHVYRLVSHATAGLLIPGQRRHWWTLFAKMTDYMGLRKPVIACVPEPSEARSHLMRGNLGVFLDGDKDQQAGVLTRFLLDPASLGAPNDAECERFTVQQQVQSFAGVFQHVTAGAKGAAL